VIHGSINPEKFTKMYEDLAERYSPDELPGLLGITSQSELEQMVLSVREDLPDELKASFDKSKQNIKTVEDLVLVLNQLFSRHKDTIEKYHYMILDFDGNKSIWVRMGKAGLRAVNKLTEICEGEGKTVDGVIREMMMEFVGNLEDQRMLDILERADDAVNPEDEILED